MFPSLSTHGTSFPFASTMLQGYQVLLGLPTPNLGQPKLPWTGPLLLSIRVSSAPAFQAIAVPSPTSLGSSRCTEDPASSVLKTQIPEYWAALRTVALDLKT